MHPEIIPDSIKFKKAITQDFDSERKAHIMGHEYPDPWEYLSSAQDIEINYSDLKHNHFYEWCNAHSITKIRPPSSDADASKIPLLFVWIGSVMPEKFQRNIMSFRKHHPSQPIIIIVDKLFSAQDKPLNNRAREFLGWAKRTKCAVIPENFANGLINKHSMICLERLAPNYGAISDIYRIHFPYILFQKFSSSELIAIVYVDCDLVCTAPFDILDTGRPLVRSHCNDILFIPNNKSGRQFLRKTLSRIQIGYRPNFYLNSQPGERITAYSSPLWRTTTMYVAQTIRRTGPDVYSPSNYYNFNNVVIKFSGSWYAAPGKRWRQLGHDAEQFKKQFTYMLFLLMQEVETFRLEYFNAFSSIDAAVAAFNILKIYYQHYFAKIRYFPFSFIHSPQKIIKLFTKSEDPSLRKIIENLAFSLITIPGNQQAQIILIPKLVALVIQKLGEKKLKDITKRVLNKPALHRFNDHNIRNTRWLERAYRFVTECIYAVTDLNIATKLRKYRLMLVVKHDYHEKIIEIYRDAKSHGIEHHQYSLEHKCDIISYAIMMNASGCIQQLKEIVDEATPRIDDKLFWSDLDVFIKNDITARALTTWEIAISNRHRLCQMIWPDYTLNYEGLMSLTWEAFINGQVFNHQHIHYLNFLLEKLGGIVDTENAFLASSRERFGDVFLFYHWLLSRNADFCQLVHINFKQKFFMVIHHIIEFYFERAADFYITPLTIIIAKLIECDMERDISFGCQIIKKIVEQEQRVKFLEQLEPSIRMTILTLMQHLLLRLKFCLNVRELRSYYTELAANLTAAGYHEADETTPRDYASTYDFEAELDGIDDDATSAVDISFGST